MLTLVFAVPWARYEIGILSGFGVSAYTTMLSSLIRFQEGSTYDVLFRYGPPFGFIVATLIWLWAFIHPPISDRPPVLLFSNRHAKSTGPKSKRDVNPAISPSLPEGRF